MISDILAEWYSKLFNVGSFFIYKMANTDKSSKDEEILIKQDSAKDKGNALENNVEFIFQSAGFETQKNVRIAKYEVDVLAKIGDRNIIIECKNYQSSNLVIRNLIHQWNSKNHIIKANKIILVIAGVNIKKSDEELADEFNIEIWGENDLTDFFNLTLKPKELRVKLLQKISFQPISISESYRDEIASIVIKPLLTNMYDDKEKKYQLFNNWLRMFIRTELQINGTSKEDRMKHIKLFEDTKEKKGFLNFKFKRKESEYWDALLERLQKENILDTKLQKKYFDYMCDLINEYNSQKGFYEDTTDKEKYIRSLIKDRLYNALISDNSICFFGFNQINVVKVVPSNEGKYHLIIEKISDKRANLINWILTSEFSLVQDPNVGIAVSHSWICLSFEEACEKIYRVLDEFFGYSDNDKLKDFAFK
jgi:hypothetical protein